VLEEILEERAIDETGQPPYLRFSAKRPPKDLGAGELEQP
jgi:hypothetical protein